MRPEWISPAIAAFFGLLAAIFFGFILYPRRASGPARLAANRNHICRGSGANLGGSF
jgi:hypothetical protein